MALYIPGQQAIFTFRVPDSDGNNITGLSWTLKSFTKDGIKVSSGSEYSSIAFSEDASGDFYKLVFTPASSSSATYMIAAISDATIPDTFELHFGPDWANIVLMAEKVVHGLATPETVTYYMPDKTTIIRTFNMTRTASQETREGA